MSTVTTISGWVYHMEIDESDTDTLLLSTYRQLLTYNTHENKLTSIAGNSSTQGYRDGVGDEALFNLITGFTQINSSTVVVADKRNNCMRQIDRTTRRGSHYVWE